MDLEQDEVPDQIGEGVLTGIGPPLNPAQLVVQSDEELFFRCCRGEDSEGRQSTISVGRIFGEEHLLDLLASSDDLIVIGAFGHIGETLPLECQADLTRLGFR